MRIILFLFFLPLVSFAQNKTGYYINWNVDHTLRYIKPSIPITKEESARINSYLVIFDNTNRFSDVKYYYSGSPSIHSSYGAFHMKRIYYENSFDDIFFDDKNNRTTNKEGAYIIRYYLNKKGFWNKKEVFDINNKLIDIKGPHTLGSSISLITRDSQNRLYTELRLNSQKDTVPDINGFKITHFGFNNDGFITYRKYLDQNKKLRNGSLGYAQVNFQCNENGVFYEEEFRDSNYKLVIHPRILAAEINFRNFDEYGKYKYIHYIDEKGYPHKDRAYAEIEYYENTSRKKGVFYDRSGFKTEDPRGVAESIFKYSKDGELIERINFNLSGQRLN